MHGFWPAQGGPEDGEDGSVHAPDLAVGPGMVRPGQAALDAVALASPVGRVAGGGGGVSPTLIDLNPSAKPAPSRA